MAAHKEVSMKFVPKPSSRVSKYAGIADTLQKDGEVVLKVPAGQKDQTYAHNLYISLFAMLTRRLGKKPKLSVRLGDKNTVGCWLTKESKK